MIASVVAAMGFRSKRGTGPNPGDCKDPESMSGVGARVTGSAECASAEEMSWGPSDHIQPASPAVGVLFPRTNNFNKSTF
ncbi:hypothetical protein PG984_002738 [Apiospora sp. TS-2023a]